MDRVLLMRASLKRAFGEDGRLTAYARSDSYGAARVPAHARWQLWQSEASKEAFTSDGNQLLLAG